jgi:DNA-binding NarL/FixJ family response regulator
MVQVLVIDDQRVFRQVAGEVIEATPGFALAAEAESGRQGLTIARAIAPDLVLLDVRMPDMNGIEVALRMTALPDAPVVVLISVEEPQNVPAARSCGAATFVRKQDFGPALLRRIWKAYGTDP